MWLISASCFASYFYDGYHRINILNLNNAIQNHSEWKMRFRAAISQCEILDVTTIYKDDCCELGRWLHGEGKVLFGNLNSHNNCVSSHATFHLEAGKIAQTINEKKYTKAWGMLDNGSPYAKASSIVADDIMKLRQEAGL